MKKVKLFLSLLMLFSICVGNVWADIVTFSYSDYKGQGTASTGSQVTMEKTDVSITETKFNCGSSASYAQLFANGVTTITPASGVTITQVVINASASSYNGYQSSGTMTWSTGSSSANNAVVTWAGSATSAFTLSHNKQIRWTSIDVTYTKSGGNQGGNDPDPGTNPEPGNSETEGTGTINFGSASGSTNVNAASISGGDSRGKTWTVTTAGTTSFTPNNAYAQIGSGSKPATSITFTTTLNESMTITDFSAKFGGFSGTAGTVTLKVGNTTVGTGSLNASNDVTVSATNKTTSGTELTVTVTGISKGVKVYYISYTVAAASTPDPGTPTVESIEIVTQPTKKTYYSEEAFDLTGLVVKANMSDNSEVTVDNNNLSLSAIDKAANKLNVTQPITVTYGGKSTTFDITLIPYTPVGACALIPYTNDTKNAIFTEGIVTRKNPSDWDAQYGNIIYWISEDGTTTNELEVYRGFDINGAKFSSLDDLKEGDKVIVSGNLKNYSGTKEYQQGSQLISHTARELSSIAISGNLENTEYGLNSTAADLNYSGLTVTATYQTGFTLDVTNAVTWSIDPATLATPGDANVTLTASYTEGTINKTATTNASLSISDKTLLSIAIPDNYSAAMYCGAEMPKPTVMATYDDGADPIDVTTACSFTVVDLLVPGERTITVSYTYGEVERTAEYQLTVNAYSVAEAQSVIPAEGNIETSVEGVIRWIDYVNTAANQGYAKYSISAVGSKDDADTLLIYNSYAGKNGEEYVYFTASNQIEVGDKVVVSGSFYTYGSNNLKETVTKQSYISSLTKKEVSSLAISGELTNTEYQQGATVDPAGLTVTATYNTGYTADVTANVEWSSDPMTTVGDAVAVALTASYGGKNANGEYSVKVIAPKQDAGLEYATAEYNANINAEFATPELTNPNNLTVTYSSSDENLAVVDENTGEVLIGENEGIVTITATFAGNAGYNAGYASYTITISDPTLTKVTFDATVDIENFTKNYITMSCTNGALDNGSEYRLYKSSTTTFECSNGDIKKIEFIGVSGNPASNFAAPEIGTFVTSGYNGTWTGSASSVAFTASANQVRVTKIIVSYKEDTRAAAGLEYAVAEYNAATNAEFETPQLTNPNNLTVTYSSSDENLAVVDENTGEVLIGANEGTVTITATFAGNETYKSGSASYTITISVPDLRYKAEKTSFDAISGKVATVTEGTHKDKEYISYAAFKGDGTTDPNADNNILTFYKPSSGKTTGGYVMISAVKGCTINEVQVTNAGNKATTIGCSTTSTLATTGEAYAKNATVSFKNLNSAVVYIDDIGTERVDIAKLVVYYIGEPAAIDHYVLDGTYETSFEQNTTFNHEGLIVYACYDELEMDKVDITSECTFSMPDMNVVGDQTIEITYNSTVVKSYTITVTPGKALPNLTYSPASVEITSGDIWSAPILGYAEGFDGVDAISYNSNKTSIATVSNEGVIALAGGFGTAVITASFEGNENYVAGSATYTITVNEPSDDLSGKWVVASSVAIGDRIIIANEAAAGVVKTMGKQNGNNRAVVLSSVDAQGVLTPAEGTKVFTLIDAGDGKFALKTLNGSYLYAAGGTSSNYLKETDTYAAASAKWGIAISNSKATIQATSAGRNWMRYNSSSDLFSCYASGQNDIVVYKIEEVAPAADAIAPIGGKFIINADRDTVVFSRGNLQYNYGTAQWSCAAHQYDVLADANLNFGKEGYDGPIDLFGWSNSVSNFGRLTSNKDADYPGVGDFIDWGVKFPGETKWTTMSKDEWEYLQAKNNWTMINLIDAEAVNEYDVFYAMVLFPENWVAPAGLENLNYKFYNFDDEPKAEQNTITVAQWNSLFEPNGAVLLPAAGSRAGYWGNMIGKDGVSTATTGLLPNGQNYDHVDNVGWYGYYWLTTQDTREDYKHCASYLILPAWSEGPTLADEDDEYRAPAVWSREKRRGHSVRLVHVIPSVKHTLSYNAGGATGEVPASVENNYIGKELTVAALGNLIRNGYTFQGWSYKGRLYQAGDKFTMPGKDATLTAKWRKDNITEEVSEHVTMVVVDANISDLGHVEEETLVVKSGTTLTADEPSAPNGIVVEKGAKYIAEEETTTPTVSFSVTMGSTQTAGTSSEIGTPANIILTTGGEITYDITLGTSMAGVQADPNQWHAFTVPFPVDALNGIYNAATNEKLRNEVDYAIMDYHGDIRADGKYGWKKYRGILVPGTFYIMTVNGDIPTFRFKLSTSGNLPTANSMAYYGYTGSGTNSDQGWNGIGNPTWEGVTLPYDVQILDPYSYEYVTLTAGSNVPVSMPFFYKAEEDNNMAITPAANPSAAPRYMETNEIKKLAVSFGNEVYTDKLYVSANEDALNRYEYNKDLVKMTMSNTPKVAQIFGKAYDMKLSVVNTPLVNDNANVALTLYTPAAGEYTVSIAKTTNATVYLVRDGHIIWNLSESAYTATFEKGDNSNYGLRLVAAPQVPTGVGQVQGDNVQCTKVIIDEQVYILRGEKLFDVTGKAVK